MKVYTVDAFASKPFTGNSAAVMPLDQPLTDKQMQHIGAEMNLSETAFLTLSDKDGSWKESSRFNLRWFTPTNEVNLCGHATLASAHVLFAELGNASTTLEFSTKSGLLTARREDKKIVLDLPAYDCKPITSEQEKCFGKLVGAVVKRCGVKGVFISSNTKKLLVRLEDTVTREQLESIVPEFSVLSTYNGVAFKGIVVTVKGKKTSGNNNAYDFFSRYFAPWNGIPEDPVTGSAHSVLAPFWADILNKSEFHCRQVSGRGGDLDLVLKGNRVYIYGEAITVLEGNFRIN